MAEFIPLRHNQQRVDTGGDRVRVTAVLDRIHLRLEHRHRLRVVGPHGGAFLQEILDDVDGGRLADVVGVGLVAQPEQADQLAPQSA